MAKIVLAGTYHKTGTVWMENVLREAAKKMEIPFYDISNEHLCNSMEERKAFLQDAIARDERAIIFENHTKFPLEGLDLSKVKGFRVVRDPRDIMISAAKYHTWSDESWLHIRRKKFNGQTYQEAINALPDSKSRMIFEMTHSTGDSIRSMREFEDYGIFKTVKYEDLIEDFNCTVWRELAMWLGFARRDLLHMQYAFYNNSIFGGGAKKTEHVQSGKKQQHLTILDDELKATFYKHFPYITRKLGYE